MGIRAAVVVVGCLAAGPVLPCSRVLVAPDPVMPGLDGANDVPTNALLFLKNPGLGWAATVVADDAPDDVVTVTNGGELRQLDGRLTLRPATSYTVTFDSAIGVDFDTPADEGGRRRIAFRTGAGDDDVVPAAPEPVQRRERIEGGLRWASTCDSGSDWIVNDPSFTVVHVDVDVPSGDVGVAFGVDDDGVVADVIDGADEEGAFGFREGDAAIEQHAFAIVDRAGNVSDAVVVDVDFGGGGCAASSSAPLALGLIALAGIRRRRGR